MYTCLNTLLESNKIVPKCCHYVLSRKLYKTATAHQCWLYQQLIQYDYKTQTKIGCAVSFKLPWFFKGCWIFYCCCGKLKLARHILSFVSFPAFHLTSAWIRITCLHTSYCSIHTRGFSPLMRLQLDEGWCGWLIWLMLVAFFPPLCILPQFSFYYLWNLSHVVTVSVSC